MSDIAIRVENLGKQYHIGGKQEQYQTLRDTISQAFMAPLRRATKLLRGQATGAAELDETIWALKDVSFEVKPGEVIGIIGRNGAGKSTLLKILSRITEPTEGYVDIYGRVGSLLEVGTGFHPELTGRENIYLNGAILGMKKAEIDRKFDEIVDFAEIERFIDTPVKHYSSGMYIRLAFAVAAHLEPEILVVDEVLAVGDGSFQKKCLGKMGDVAKEGRTVLFVSHNIPAIRTLCHRAILLENGIIVRDGEASKVVRHYLEVDGPQNSQRVWTNGQGPSNRSVRLKSVKLKDGFGLETSSINISEEALIDINYEVVENGAQVGFSLVLFDNDGYCVFSSLSNREKNFYGKPLRRGRYTSTCRIYGNLLNSGRFYVSIIGFSANWSDSFRVDQVISLEAVDDGVLKGDYYGNYGGVIRPDLEWKTKLL